MGEKRAETTIDRSAAEVWARIGNFGENSWFRGVESVKLQGNERTTKMQGSALRTVERLLSRDDARRTYTYGTVGVVGDSVVQLKGGGAFDVASLCGHHRATITVTPVAESSSRVTYDAVVDDNDKMAETIGTGYQGVLDHLKAELEG